MYLTLNWLFCVVVLHRLSMKDSWFEWIRLLSYCNLNRFRKEVWPVSRIWVTLATWIQSFSVSVTRCCSPTSSLMIRTGKINQNLYRQSASFELLHVWFFVLFFRDFMNQHNKITKGDITDEITAVLKALWSGQYRSISCTDFKVG